MEIRKICVIGAGTMGSGITQLIAQNGYEVTVRDIEDKFVQKGVNGIKTNLQRFFVDKGKMSQTEADTISARISGTTDLKEAVSGAQVVIESIVEDIKLKTELMKQLDEFCSPDTILASNTSSLHITEIAAATTRPEKVIGMHFFNPATVMKLVELIPGIKTSDETYQIIKDLSIKLGKEVVTSKDSAGFIVNRIFLGICNEAAKLVYEGIATPEDVDKGCQFGLGHAMGPFKTLDLSGVDIGYHVLNILRDEFGESFRPCPLITMKVLAGDLGVKTGKGFYDYDQK